MTHAKGENTISLTAEGGSDVAWISGSYTCILMTPPCSWIPTRLKTRQLESVLTGRCNVTRTGMLPVKVTTASHLDDHYEICPTVIISFCILTGSVWPRALNPELQNKQLVSPALLCLKHSQSGDTQYTEYMLCSSSHQNQFCLWISLFTVPAPHCLLKW